MGWMYYEETVWTAKKPEPQPDPELDPIGKLVVLAFLVIGWVVLLTCICILKAIIS